MKLPRPLLLVVIVLALLGVVGLVGGLAGGSGGSADPGSVRDSLAADLGRLLGGAGLLPEPPDIELDTSSAPCLSGDRLILASPELTCTVTIVPTHDDRRRLRLRLLTSTPIGVSVKQIVDGEEHAKDSTLPFDDHGTQQTVIELTVRRDDSAVIKLDCQPGGCQLAVDPHD